MSFGLRAPVLVLNRSFLPVRVTTARMAFELLYQGRGMAVDENYDTFDFEAWLSVPVAECESIGTTMGPVRVPRVMVLVSYNRIPQSVIRLSRRNIYLRDDYTCQYCGDRPGVHGLNLDHVVPRCRGGQNSWENLVTSCMGCNLKKGRHMPEECGMFPANKPVRPRWNTALHFHAIPRRFQEWEPFLRGSNRVGHRRKASDQLQKAG